MSNMFFGTLSMVIVPIAALLLFWLGRSQPAEPVVFAEYDDNDPGEDVDDDV